MSEYNIGFSEKLIDAARIVAASSTDRVDEQRTILYLSLLSAEIALKAFLEQAGVSIKEIRNCSHNHEELLAKLDHCEIQVEVTPNQLKWVSASRVRAISVYAEYSESTIGALFSLKNEGASQYPNQIRYGNTVSHAPAGVMLQASERLLKWVNSNLNSVRRKQRDSELKPKQSPKKSLRRRDTHMAVRKFCEAYGDGLQVGGILEYYECERSERGQDYWIGFELLNYKGEKCGEISAGYVYGGTGAYAEIVIDDEVIETDSSRLESISHHNKEKNEQPKELKKLLIKLSDRAARRIVGGV